MSCLWVGFAASDLEGLLTVTLDRLELISGFPLNILASWHWTVLVTSRQRPLGTQFVVQSLSHVQLFVTPVDCNTPDFSVLHYFSELAQIHVH